MKNVFKCCNCDFLFEAIVSGELIDCINPYCKDKVMSASRQHESVKLDKLSHLFCTSCEANWQGQELVCPYCHGVKVKFFGLSKVENDPINHPPHYISHPSGIECIQITEHMGFNLGNVIKYIWRVDDKGHDLEDLQKAMWYLKREIERRDKKNPNIE